ncbi:hypothetical protein KCP75_25230 [Salmonella enterica subsp. enterica]|nr:hypothetical protein KCP75_25230 [Salmonella enterica subsp. enterica]
MLIRPKKNIVVQNKINATHESSGKNAKIEAPEEQTNFIVGVFALLCGCIFLALVLLGRARALLRLSPGYGVQHMRSLRVPRKSPPHAV